jgi:hypothetical protein
MARAAYTYNTNGATFDHTVALNDSTLITSGKRGPADSCAFFTGDYKQWNFVITNSIVEGFGIGIAPGSSAGLAYVPPGTSLLVQNTRLANYWDIYMAPIWGLGIPEHPELLARTVTFDNDNFEVLAPPNPFFDFGAPGYVYMAGWQLGQATLLTVLDQLFITRLNGDPNNNVQVYYQEQKADAVFIASGTYRGSTVLGSPEAGLTNAQTWAKYGVAYAGAVAPPSASPENLFPGALVDKL